MVTINFTESQILVVLCFILTKMRPVVISALVYLTNNSEIDFVSKLHLNRNIHYHIMLLCGRALHNKSHIRMF